MSEYRDNCSNTFLGSLRDSGIRRRLAKWVWIPVSAFAMGILLSQMGPAFPDLQILTGTDIQTASYFFTSSAFGCLLGSALSGNVHGKMDNNVLVIFLTLFCGGSVLLIPYCTSFVTMLLVMFLFGVSQGLIMTVWHVEHMRIWGRKGQTKLQFIHFLVSVGGIVAPLLTEPFLAEKESTGGLVLAENISTQMVNISLAEIWNRTYSNQSQDSNSSIDATPCKTSHVHYAFLISGGIMLTTCLPVIAMLFGHKSSTVAYEVYSQETPKRQLSPQMFSFVAILLFMFISAYCFAEQMTWSYLTTFLMQKFDSVSTSQGSAITSMYWVSMAIGRFVSIFVAKYVYPCMVIAVHMSILFIAYIGFTVSSQYGQVGVVTGFICMMGVATSAVLPASFSWTEDELTSVTSRISSLIMFGSSLVSIIGPVFMGYLMQNVSLMWLCYLLLISSGLSVFFFLSLLLINRFYLNRKFGTLH